MTSSRSNRRRRERRFPAATRPRPLWGDRRQQLSPRPPAAGFDLAGPSSWHGDGLALYVVCDDGRRLYTGGCSFSEWDRKKTFASARRMLRMLEMGTGRGPVATYACRDAGTHYFSVNSGCNWSLVPVTV